MSFYFYYTEKGQTGPPSRRQNACPCPVAWSRPVRAGVCVRGRRGSTRRWGGRSNISSLPADAGEETDTDTQLFQIVSYIVTNSVTVSLVINSDTSTASPRTLHTVSMRLK